ncbi:DNA adenine methylase [Mycoplasma sp. Z244C]
MKKKLQKQKWSNYMEHNLDKEISQPKPFVKWAGGKRQLLDELIKYVPKDFNTYYEPFVGGGALFFKLQPKKAVINDINKHLISAYRCFQDETLYQDLIKSLKEYETNHSEENFYRIRALDRDKEFLSSSNSEIGARLIYLNKICFNGIYRVNSSGYFNCSFNKKLNIKTFYEDNFNAIFKYFSNNEISILSTSFQEVIQNVKSKDFVYLDPPYDAYNNKKIFISYDANGFSQAQQEELAKCFAELDKKGAFVMLSNHNTPLIRELYKNYNINVVLAKRWISGNGNYRGEVEEVIITNY